MTGIKPDACSGHRGHVYIQNRLVPSLTRLVMASPTSPLAVDLAVCTGALSVARPGFIECLLEISKGGQGHSLPHTPPRKTRVCQSRSISTSSSDSLLFAQLVFLSLSIYVLSPTSFFYAQRNPQQNAAGVGRSLSLPLHFLHQGIHGTFFRLQSTQRLLGRGCIARRESLGHG